MFGHEWNSNSLYHVAFPIFISMSLVDMLKKLVFHQRIEVCKLGIWYWVFWFYHRIYWKTCRDGYGSADMWRLPYITYVYTWGCKCEMLLLSNSEPCARYNCLKLFLVHVWRTILSVCCSFSVWALKQLSDVCFSLPNSLSAFIPWTSWFWALTFFILFVPGA